MCPSRIWSTYKCGIAIIMSILTANLTATSLPTELDKNTYTHVYDRCLHHDHNIELSNFCTHIDWLSQISS